MKRVFKYLLDVTDLQDVRLPQGAKILTAQMQGDQLCLWALVDQDALHLTEWRRIRIAGTGHEIEADSIKYISTVQLHGGALVYHIFEVLQ